MRKMAMLLAIVLVPISNATAAPNYVFPIQGCKATYVKAHHNYPATDIMAKVGCAFVAPTSGVIGEVNRVDRFTWKTNKGADRGGLFISVIGEDGVRYYGSHLSKIPAGLEPGTPVKVGDVIGYVGQSGDAKGLAPHVHFGISWNTKDGIWWVRRGEIYPWKYLDLWKSGKDANPSSAVAKIEKAVGTIPPIPKY